MKIRKRVLFLVLAAIFINGYALNSVTAKVSVPGCYERCTENRDCCRAQCWWFDPFCISECGATYLTCFDRCTLGGEPAPESCPQN